MYNNTNGMKNSVLSEEKFNMRKWTIYFTYLQYSNLSAQQILHYGNILTTSSNHNLKLRDLKYLK